MAIASAALPQSYATSIPTTLVLQLSGYQRHQKRGSQDRTGSPTACLCLYTCAGSLRSSRQQHRESTVYPDESRRRIGKRHPNRRGRYIERRRLQACTCGSRKRIVQSVPQVHSGSQDQTNKRRHHQVRPRFYLSYLLHTDISYRKQPQVVKFLYDQLAAQCKQCGIRFADTSVGKKKMEDHLDMHFRQNRKANQNIGRGHSRSWFTGLEVRLSRSVLVRSLSNALFLIFRIGFMTYLWMLRVKAVPMDLAL